MIEAMFVRIASAMALIVEAGSILLVFFGSIQALYRLFLVFIRPGSSLSEQKAIWVRHAMWLLLGLEFFLAADIIRTAISPSWSEIGQLAAIAVIRTFLNIFLTRDIKDVSGV